MQEALKKLGSPIRGRRTRGQTTVGLCWGLAVVAAAAALACADVQVTPNVGADRPSGTGQAGMGQETIVRLYPTAVITSDRVTLKDIAQIEGPSAELIGRLELAPTPSAGDTLLVELPLVRESLAHRGVNISRWIFRGSSRCKVTRPGQPAGAGRAPGADKALTAGHPGNTNSASQLAAATQPQGGVSGSETLEELLRAHIATQLADLHGRPVVRFSPKLAEALALRRPQYDFKIVDLGKHQLGEAALQVTVCEKERVRQVLQVLACVALRVPVVEAARPINRGEIITDGHLVLREREVERTSDIGLLDPKPIIGQRVKRFVDKGEMLTARHLEPVPLVNRNDLVTVWVRRGGLVLKASAKACQAGDYGEAIELRSAMSKESFRGMVTGPKTVEIPDAQAETVVAAAPSGPGVNP